MDSTIRPGVTLIRNLSILALTLAGCSQEPTPITSEHVAFVGVWEQGRFGEGTTYQYLQISASGYIASARFEKTGGRTTCVVMARMPVKIFTRSQISASFLRFFTIDFEINKPPTEVGDTIRMTIDGNELTKTDSRQDGFDHAWSCSGPDLVRSPPT